MAMNALMQTIYDDVQALVKRPDLEESIKTYIRMATRKLHNKEFFKYDRVEEAVDLGSDSYLQTLSYRNIFPQFKKLDYVRLLVQDSSQPSGYSGGKFLKVYQSPDSILDSYGNERSDLVYYAGDVLQFKFYSPQRYVIIGYYKFPITSEALYDSWIARDYQDAVTLLAASMAFKLIGFDEQSSQAMVMQREAERELLMNAIATEGD